MKKVVAPAAAAIAVLGLVGGFALAQRGGEQAPRTQLVQPAAETVAPTTAATTTAPEPTTTTAAPATTTAAPKPVTSTKSSTPKASTVQRQAVVSSDPTPVDTTPTIAPDDPIRQTAPAPSPGGVQVPGQPFKPGEYELPPPPAPSTTAP